MAIQISGSTIIDDSRNIVNAGIVTATSFSGDGTNLTGVGIGSTGSINTAGIITASSFVGNGAGLTGVGIGTTGSVNTSGIITASNFGISGTIVIDSSRNIINTASITSSGNITAYSSDKRLKENFHHIESPIEKVQKLNGYTFDWNEKSKELGFIPKHETDDTGLIAQEVQEVFPQAVDLAPFDSNFDEGKKTSKSGENYLTIQYERLVPLLVEAIKEQQNQISELKATIEEMK